jgi:TRAP-type C4-dicarboxylate transport system substrate-binding protein
MDAGARSVYTTKPVRTPEDLKGLKIRMMGNPLFVETMNAMGGNGMSMGFNELYNALQTGVVDGAENNPPTLLEHNHYQNAKFYSLTGHLILPEPIVMSKITWNKLTPEQQVLVKKTAKAAQAQERTLWDAKSASSEEKLKAAGVEFITVDKKPFYEATASIREKYGAPYADLIKRIEAVQ